MKSTAKIEYRSYAPSGWIAIPYANIEIYGDPELKKKWEELQSENHNKFYGGRDNAKQKFLDQQKDCDMWRKESFWNRFKKYPKEKDLEHLRQEYSRLDGSLLGDHAFEDKYCAQNLLEENGYVLTSSVSGKCGATTEIWEKSYHNK